jgi:hypothetical protein
MSSTFTFKIDGEYKPATIPMERLGEYLEALGKLLGDTANVHFDGVLDGSVVVVARVDDVAVPKVERRVSQASYEDAPKEIVKARKRLDDLLWEDNATGRLSSDDGKVIYVDFQGRDRPKSVTYGPIKQLGTIDGEVFRVEGRDETVHVGVMDGPRTYSLQAPAAMGQALAKLFRNGVVRFSGEGNWLRHGNGNWELRWFKISNFDVLDQRSIDSVLDDLREVGVGNWREEFDPLGALKAERENDH